MAICLDHQALLFGSSQSFNALPLDFRLLQHGRNQFVFTAFDFRFLHLYLLLFLHLLYFHLFRDHLLLHHVGLDVISLIGLRLLLLGDLEVLRPLHFQVTLRLGLFGE